jgi:DNA (cytosine-5)-methyltransferase 1
VFVSGLVLSLFPGIGLLDQAFEEEGFCVVRGPDPLWGGDIRRFKPPATRFDGVIGGPPCQSWSGLGNVNRARWGDDCMMPDMIPEFVRVVEEVEPAWFVMENVPAAPVPMPANYAVVARLCDNRWVGGEQQRRRRFTFGVYGGEDAATMAEPAFHIEGVALEAVNRVGAVISTGQNGKGGSRASIASMARAQGLDPARFDNSPFTTTELRRAIANGVPLPMGRAVARAVKRAITPERSAA